MGAHCELVVAYETLAFDTVPRHRFAPLETTDGCLSILSYFPTPSGTLAANHREKAVGDVRVISHLETNSLLMYAADEVLDFGDTALVNQIAVVWLALSDFTAYRS